MSKAHTLTVTIALTMAAALITGIPTETTTPADTTIAPCAWFNSSHPIPADTSTTVCVDSTGRLRNVPQA